MTVAAVAQNQNTITTNGYERYLWHLADSLDKPSCRDC